MLLDLQTLIHTWVMRLLINLVEIITNLITAGTAAGDASGGGGTLNH